MGMDMGMGETVFLMLYEETDYDYQIYDLRGIRTTLDAAMVGFANLPIPSQWFESNDRIDDENKVGLLRSWSARGPLEIPSNSGGKPRFPRYYLCIEEWAVMDGFER